VQDAPKAVVIPGYIMFLAVWTALCLPITLAEMLPAFLFGFNWG
jgi:hypothetical protein